MFRDTSYLSSYVQMETGLSPAQATKAVQAMINALDESLMRTGGATLPTIGKFEIVGHRINTAGLRNQRPTPSGGTRWRLKFKPMRLFVEKINKAGAEDVQPNTPPVEQSSERSESLF